MSLPFSPALRGELGACLRLALPLVLAQVSFVGMMVTDVLMAGRLGETDLAAVALGSNLWSPVFLFFLGVCSAASPLTAHLFGAGRPPAETGAYLRRALRLALVLALVWWLLLRLAAEPALALLRLEPALAVLARDYLHALGWGIPATCVFCMLRSAAEGMGQSRPVMACGLLALALNAVLDYGFMFGRLGLPELGAVGAGWATALSFWAMALAMAALYRWHPRLRAARLWSREAAPAPAQAVRETLQVGLPIGVTWVMEAGIFACVGLLMTRFGTATVGAHQIALSFAALTFMVPLGVSMAVTVRVGQAAGRGDAAALRLAGWTGIGLALACNLVSTAVMLLLPGPIVALYTTEAAVAAQAVLFLQLAGLFQAWDALQVAANGALRGLKDTRAPMWLTLAAYWLIGLPVAWGLAFHTGLAAAGLWVGLIIGLAAAALFLNLRFYRRTKIS